MLNVEKGSENWIFFFNTHFQLHLRAPHPAMSEPRAHKLTLSHTTYRIKHVTITGSHCAVYGDGCAVWGSHCIVWGNHCTVYGSHCKVYGDHCRVIGSHAQVEGHECHVIGPHARVRHDDCITDGAKWCTYIGDGIARPTVTVGTGIGVMAGSGKSMVFGRDGMTIAEDGVVRTVAYDSAAAASSSSASETAAASSASSSSSAAKRTCPDDDADDARKRTPVPVDHVVQKAADGDKECQICMENRVDACLDPCRHTALCVDCARLLYFDTDESKRACPICRKTFTRIEAVILS